MLRRHLFGCTFVLLLTTAHVEWLSIDSIFEISLDGRFGKWEKHAHNIVIDIDCGPRLRGGYEEFNNTTERPLSSNNNTKAIFKPKSLNCFGGRNSTHRTLLTPVIDTTSCVGSTKSPDVKILNFASDLWKADQLNKMNRTALIAILRKHGNFTCQRLKKTDLIEQVMQYQSASTSASRLLDTYGCMSPMVINSSFETVLDQYFL